MRVLGLIPVRGGSKGVPRKNEKLLSGKPLLQYTIESANEASLLSHMTVSTEDDKLYTLAQNLGVHTPIRRPILLAQDSSSSIEVVQHALKALKKQGLEFDAVCLLQVTTPFRAKGMIDTAIASFIKAGTDALVSVLAVPHEYNPHWVFTPNNAGHLEIATGDAMIIKRRQDLPPAYIRDGAIYLTKTEVLLQEHSFYGSSLTYVISDAQRHVNIDTIQDWVKAEELAKNLFS